MKSSTNGARLLARARREIARNHLLGEADRLLRENRQMCCYSFDYIAAHINIDGRFDTVVLGEICALLRSRIGAGAVLDIGANIGNHTVALLETGRAVFAFEPHPRTFALLQLNAGGLPGARLFNLGASDRAATLRAVSPAHNVGGTEISDRALSPTETEWRFEVIRLDDLADLRDVDIAFVKIDVEGHESQALAGAMALIERHRPVILIELIASQIADGRSAALDMLRRIGYSHVYSIDVETPWRTPSRWPFLLKRPLRVLESLLYGPAEPRARITPIERLEDREYPAIVASPDPLW